VFVLASIVATGAPARQAAAAAAAAAALPTPIDVEIDATQLPAVTVSSEVRDLNSDAAADPSQVAVALAKALFIENQAMLDSDTSLLRFSSEGPRLLEMERKVQAAAALGQLTVSDYAFTALHLEVVFTDGPQGGASLALAAQGELTEVQYNPDGVELERRTQPFDAVFALSPQTEGRWVISAVMDHG
jgi:hypothetical protein